MGLLSPSIGSLFYHQFLRVSKTLYRGWEMLSMREMSFNKTLHPNLIMHNSCTLVLLSIGVVHSRAFATVDHLVKHGTGHHRILKHLQDLHGSGETAGKRYKSSPSYRETQSFLSNPVCCPGSKVLVTLAEGVLHLPKSSIMNDMLQYQSQLAADSLFTMMGIIAPSLGKLESLELNILMHIFDTYKIQQHPIKPIQFKLGL